MGPKYLLNAHPSLVSFKGNALISYYVNGSGSITSVGEERANLSAVYYLQVCGFCLERFPLPPGA